jgi:hypothetical protein
MVEVVAAVAWWLCGFTFGMGIMLYWICFAGKKGGE